MIARLLSAAAMLALVGAAPAPKSIPTATFVNWDSAGAGGVVTAGGLVVANATAPCPAAGEDRDADCRVPAATIAGRGAPVRLVSGTTGPHGRIGIGTLERGRGPGVILATFTGGAHCCERYDVALPGPAGWRRVSVSRIEATDRGPVRQTEFDHGLDRFPTDIDGDGRADFVVGDDAFAYAFDDYADSWVPPVVLTIAGDRFVDVSRRPAFRPLFEADMAKARRSCIAPGPQRSPNGSCAGYAADAARLGRLAQAWPEVLAHYDHGQDGPGAFPRCTADYVAGKCPPGHAVSYPDYPTALRAFLVRTGYVAR